jgi:predicted O-linked N-acetylglucosamine transferase (SPINDLY family)
MDSLQEAERFFVEALSLQERGDLEGARRLYEQALERAPDRPSVLNNLAAVCIALKRHAEAIGLCRRLLELDPGDAAALVNLGVCQCESGLPEEALRTLGRVLSVQPEHPDALNNLGNAQLALGRPGEALRSYERALAAHPGHVRAHYNRANALLELNRPEEALAGYERALALDPRHADAHYNRANVLRRLGRLEEALAGYERALDAEPRHTGALNNRILILQILDRREELVAAWRRLLEVAPAHPYAPGQLLNAQLHCCDWSDYAASVARVVAAVRSGERADAPFNFLAISDSASDQLRCARTCAADEYPASGQPLWRGERYRHERIRLAYVSADLHGHAMSYLLAGLYEAHDRGRFEVSAVSLGPERNDAMRSRLRNAFDRFIDARGEDDRAVATRLREMEIDIAVDLQGYTYGCRPGIFAHRPAPVQVNYLGFPGTMGADYMDYLVADRRVIPPEERDCYSEKIVYLPDCYQANDDKRRIAARTPSRAELGLPERGFVFCCFNNNYKIAPPVFDIWMRLLDRVRGSVLWLLEDNPAAARNLRGEAVRRGVAAERLVFAPRVAMEEHLARQRQADLFLDTLPYNAHVTASDALWAGLPVLTRVGTTFAGRVGSSLLKAAGLEELVTTSAGEYEALALRLATDGALLGALRERLSANRPSCALFDTRRFCRHIEAAYAVMFERSRRGEGPEGFEVPARSRHEDR